MRISFFVVLGIVLKICFQSQFVLAAGPKPGEAGLYFHNESTLNDVQVRYGLSSFFTPQAQFIRNHRKGYLELHYAMVQLRTTLLESPASDLAWSVRLIPGAGMANKLSGFNRFAWTVGGEIEAETPRVWGLLQVNTYQAKDFDDKTSIWGRSGFLLNRETNDSLRFYFLMQALRETYNTYTITWGPILRLRAERVMVDFYNNVKGDFGMSFQWNYPF